MSAPLVHRLEKPLRIATANESEHLYLPKGTLLYYEESRPEGFDRYRVYINVPGGLPLAPPTPLDLVDPLTGYFDETP